MDKRKPTNALLVQNVVSPYRIPLFEKIGLSDDIDFTVLLTAETCKHRPHWNWDRDELPFRCEALKGFSWAKNHAKTFFFSPSLLIELVRRRPDVVVSNGFSAATAMSLAYTVLFRKRNLIWSESTHATEAKVGSMKRLYRKSLAWFADGFIDAGQLSRKYLKSLIGERDSRPFSRVYNCVETDRFAEPANRSCSDLGLSETRRKILFVGRMDENKNVRTLLASYEKILTEHGDGASSQIPQLVLVGEGPLDDFVKEKQQMLGAEHVVVCGHQPYEKMPAYYQRCDLFVLLSYSDCNPLVILEAISCGLPIICTDRAGNAIDFIEPGVNGYIVAPADVVKIAGHLTEICGWGDKELAEAEKVASQSIEKTRYDSVANEFIGAILEKPSC